VVEKKVWEHMKKLVKSDKIEAKGERAKKGRKRRRAFFK